MKGAQKLLDFVTTYVTSLPVFDPDTLNDAVQITFYDYYVHEIPLYENQESYWRDLEVIESIWKMKPDIECPDILSKPLTPATVHDRFVCTWICKFFGPEKRRIDLNYENSIKIIPSLILFVVCDILLRSLLNILLRSLLYMLTLC